VHLIQVLKFRTLAQSLGYIFEGFQIVDRTVTPHIVDEAVPDIALKTEEGTKPIYTRMARQEPGPRHVPPLDIVDNAGPDGLPRHEAVKAVLIAAIVVVCGSWLIKTETGGDASSPEGVIVARTWAETRPDKTYMDGRD
jgi:hypothetical protein